MSVQVLLNLLNKLIKRAIKCEAHQAFYHFFATSLINYIIQSTNVRSYLSYDIQITLKSHYWREKDKIFSLCTQRYYGRHNVSRKSVNHWLFIDFIAWHYFTPRLDVI